MSRIRFLFRQDSADAWTSNNPVLAAGEIGVELDSAGGVSPKFKIGNGILAWNDSSFNYFINDSDQSALAGAGGGASGLAWAGDRAVIPGGFQYGNTAEDRIEYFDITTAGNASNFGNLSSTSRGTDAVSDKTYGVFQISVNASYSNNTNYFEYVTIATTGNATDFGDEVSGNRARFTGSCQDGTYGYIAGGSTGSASNVIQSITIATPGNATDFGDLTQARFSHGGCNDSTRGLFGGGGTDTVNSNTIDYVTMGSSSNASDFGDLSAAKSYVGACADNTYGVFGGGDTGSFVNVIEYVTIQTTGNATDFGDLSATVSGVAGTNNDTRGVFAGGNLSGNPTVSSNTIEYITIATPGNATDLGDMVFACYQHSMTSGSPS